MFFRQGESKSTTAPEPETTVTMNVAVTPAPESVPTVDFPVAETAPKSALDCPDATCTQAINHAGPHGS
jgi:hypothetical protein